MPNNYKPMLIQVRPQYTSGATHEESTPENVLWFQGANAGAFPLTVSQLTLIAAAFDPAWGNDVWYPQSSDHYAYTGSIITDWSTATGEQYNSVGTFSPVTGNFSNYYGAQMSMLTSIQSQGMPKYRGGHPRCYLPFGGSLLVDAWTWPAAQVAAVQAGWASLDTAMNGIGSVNGGPYQQMVYRHRSSPNPALPAIYAVTHRVVQSRVATQRRRLRKAPHH